MYILIPVDSDNEFDAKITTLVEMKTWALVEFDAGKAQSVIFNKDKEALGVDWIDYVILQNKFENSFDFMNEGMICLSIREEETIEEIISAFAFKELDEVGL